MPRSNRQDSTHKIVCPRCDTPGNQAVIDSREGNEAIPGFSSHIRRRRACRTCGYRFTTIEVIKDEAVSLSTTVELSGSLVDTLRKLADLIERKKR